MSAVTRKAS